MSNLEVFRNNDFEIKFVIKSRDTETDIVSPVNLTGATLHFVAKKNRSSEAVIEKSITSFTDASEGLASITLTNSDTDIVEGTYKYEAKLVDSTGEMFTLNTGDITIKQSLKQL